MKKLILISALLLVACDDPTVSKRAYDFLKCEIKDETITFKNIINDDHTMLFDTKSRADSIHKNSMAAIGKNHNSYNISFDHGPWGITTVLLAVYKSKYYRKGTEYKEICMRDLGGEYKGWENSMSTSFFYRLRQSKCSEFEVSISRYTNYSATIFRQNLILTKRGNRYYCDFISYEELQLFEDKLNSIVTEVEQHKLRLFQKEDKYREEIRRKLREKNKI